MNSPGGEFHEELDLAIIAGDAGRRGRAPLGIRTRHCRFRQWADFGRAVRGFGRRAGVLQWITWTPDDYTVGLNAPFRIYRYHSAVGGL